MSMINFALDNLGLHRLLKVDDEVAEGEQRRQSIRSDLDRRLDDVTKATIDSEDEWFLDLVKKDPNCAIEVVRECNLDESND